MILGGVNVELCGHCGGCTNGAHGSVGIFGQLAQCECPRDSILEVADVKTKTGEPSRAGEAGASAPMSSALPAGDSPVSHRAVPVVVERSPGGGRAFHIRVNGRATFMARTTQETALAFTALRLERLGADPGECARVVALLAAELGRLRRAEVTAEVPVTNERRVA